MRTDSTDRDAVTALLVAGCSTMKPVTSPAASRASTCSPAPKARPAPGDLRRPLGRAQSASSRSTSWAWSRGDRLTLTEDFVCRTARRNSADLGDRPARRAPLPGRAGDVVGTAEGWPMGRR